MIKTIYGKKLTPNQAAKFIIVDFLDRSAYWQDSIDSLFEDQLTENDIDKISEQMEKRVNSVIKYLKARHIGS